MNKLSKKLAIVSVTLSLILLTIVIREHYVQRLYAKFVTSPVNIEQLIEMRRLSEPYAELNVMLNSSVSMSKSIVMFGDSQTSRVNWNWILNRLDVVNMGIAGDITSGMVTRIGVIAKLKPRICIFQGGVNDINCGIDDDNVIISNFQTMIDTAKNSNSIPVLSTVAYTSGPYNEQNPINVRISTLNEKLKVLAKINNIEIIDINTAISDGKFALPKYVAADGVHYSYHGCLVWRDLINKLLLRFHI